MQEWVTDPDFLFTVRELKTLQIGDQVRLRYPVEALGKVKDIDGMKRWDMAEIEFVGLTGTVWDVKILNAPLCPENEKRTMNWTDPYRIPGVFAAWRRP